jgi:MinD-like ATPase involved in chromosome partitioning or flagellar assembly
MHSAIVEAANVAAADAEIDAANLASAICSASTMAFADVLGGERDIDDLAFAHAARARLADADDVQRAAAADIADDGADFRSAHFQSNDD